MSEISGVDPSVPPSGEGCADCEATGGWWVHLRRCAQCGHVGCCDSSPSQHATAHASATGHPIVQSFEPGESWFWDYASQDYYDGPSSRLRTPTPSASRFRGRLIGSRTTGAATCTDVLRWWRARDPGGYALRRAIRAAVVVPLNFAIGSQLIGQAPVATFAAFGSFALLLFANFPGGRATLAGSYATLAVAGAVLVTLGTLVATPDWLAVASMVVVAFVVLFAGVVSSVINGGTQAALLAFILAVMLPGTRADLPLRLAGWGLAVAVAVPVAVFVWPPAEQTTLRRRASQLCRTLAGTLHPDPVDGGPDRLVELGEAGRALRTAFRASAARFAAVSTGSRLGIRLVDELEWLTTIVANACEDPSDQWSAEGLELRRVSATLLDACADSLDHPGERPPDAACSAVLDGIARLDEVRNAVTDEAVRRLRAGAQPDDGGSAVGEFDRPLYSAHELGYAVGLCARTVSAIAAANRRSWWARLLGRRPGVDEVGAATAVRQTSAAQLDRHSVWLQNSLRGAVGLAVAVLLARVSDAQNAFWVGLGALSVLRTNATATGATVVRALAGTVIGFAVGGTAVLVLGTDPAVLWPLLPLVVLVSALAPAVIPFIAGQAAFSVFSIVLFNIIAPSGWRIGVFRIEDVALGCLASLAAGVLLWPRGAGAALGSALAEAYRASAAQLRAAVDRVTGGDGTRSAPDAAAAAGSRLDDALRQYLAERGSKHVSLEDVAALANGATRLRLAGTAIARLRPADPGGAAAVADDLAGPVDVLTHRADEITDWYAGLASAFEDGAAVPAVSAADGSFLEVVLPAVDRCGDPGLADRAERLLWSGQYLGDVDQLRAHLVPRAERLRAVRSRPWWRR